MQSFHWELEFPDVFLRENPGFDAVVGNPPFLGGTSISSNLGACYPEWLKAIHENSHGNADLVAHFFRRAFDALRQGGAFGLIATNTIAQGDTRESGLLWICTHGGEIYDATRRLKWPGAASVVVSVVHVCRGAWRSARRLDGRLVPTITAFLFHSGGHESPKKLAENAGKSFVGSIVLGMGFTFDDTDKSGAASPIAEMHRLIAKDPRNAERIFPYIGGKEVNTSPTHAHHRYIINFGDMSEEEARQWPDLMVIVEAKVKPGRAHLTTNDVGRKRAAFWWHYGSTAKEMFRAIAGLTRVLAVARVNQHVAVARIPTFVVPSDALIIFPFDTYAPFAVLQSRKHDIWSRFFGSSLKDDPRYAPTDCFETFPFPQGWEGDATLEAAGEAYYTYRADLMVRRNEGLTKTYNRFHDPEETTEDILKLRALHAQMDEAVLAAYGWQDIDTTCDFYLDHEAPDAGKKPWRYRWSDGTRDAVLGRLWALNEARSKTKAKVTMDVPLF